MLERASFTHPNKQKQPASASAQQDYSAWLPVQDDNTFRDAVTFATILAILWVFASAYGQLEKLP